MATIFNPAFGSRKSNPLAGVIEVGVFGAAVTELGRRIVGGAGAPGEAIHKEVELCDDNGGQPHGN